MRQNIWAAVGCVLAAVVIAVVAWPSSEAAALVTLVIGIVTGVAMVAATLRREPHLPWDQAHARVSEGRAVVFWKPTCTYCTRLLRTLRDDDRMLWVNVWADPAANREVRRHNAGDEFTPTALVGTRVLRNPTASELKSALE